MNNEATIEKMEKMKLRGMTRGFQNIIKDGVKHNFTLDEFIAHLIDAEWDDRINRKINKLILKARFRYQAVIEEIYFNRDRNLDKNMILRFSDCNWIQSKQNIIITGPTGVGKSYLASALGHQVCMQGYKVLYFNCMKLFSQLKYSQADGSYARKMDKIQNSDLFILDDFGLQTLDGQNRLSLFEIIEDRHGKKSTVIVSQQPLSNWHEIIGDPTIADAICDRIVHAAYKIDLKGESVRKIQKVNDQQPQNN